jgi:8-oxo-dGTP diphosphatase
MLEVKFYQKVDDKLLKFAVIVSKYNEKWVLCKHKERNTYECPGGHREKNENILDTAKRELFEETGAVEFSLKEISVYSVIKDEEETYGMLYYADIKKLGKLPNLEIEKIELFDELPNNWTYPLIQPILVKKTQNIQRHLF